MLVVALRLLNDETRNLAEQAIRCLCVADWHRVLRHSLPHFTTMVSRFDSRLPPTAETSYSPGVCKTKSRVTSTAGSSERQQDEKNSNPTTCRQTSRPRSASVCWRVSTCRLSGANPTCGRTRTASGESSLTAGAETAA